MTSASQIFASVPDRIKAEHFEIERARQRRKEISDIKMEQTIQKTIDSIGGQIVASRLRNPRSRWIRVKIQWVDWTWEEVAEVSKCPNHEFTTVKSQAELVREAAERAGFTARIRLENGGLGMLSTYHLIIRDPDVADPKCVIL